MLLDFSRFNLVIRSVGAKIKIEPWSSALGAKGKLQEAWFKVGGIPVDQRSVRTLAKVGGLVGKTTAIDEGTRFKQEYVRLRIACRDVSLVPGSAEGNLGLFIYDFSFEREITEDERKAREKAPVGVEDPEVQPSSKKPRTENNNNLGQTNVRGFNNNSNTTKKVEDNGGRRSHSSLDKIFGYAQSAPGKLSHGKEKASDIETL
ncbi:uncharacterized protein C2845_PM07G02880 [Panicum miliaceum]|uniref:DUF4283 domain-containing protein n=1 Tax=Panicum miliaceum TaxID=4540 RepID=A0A3L6SLZ1_PANMI|nr:uncharacterized protein C2845_PM07G02880 [Panicum miliaceum]